MAELNEYDKEFLIGYCKPVKELRLILTNIKPWETGYGTRVKDCKDFEYQGKQAYHFNNQYYYD